MARVLNIEINGQSANVEDVHRVATWNYGHFTSMQVRDGMVRGLDLHLRRLEGRAHALFGEKAEHDEGRIRELIRHGLGEERAASVRVTVVPRVGAPASTDIVGVGLRPGRRCAAAGPARPHGDVRRDFHT